MMRVTDRLIAPTRGTLEQAMTYAARFRFPNADQDVTDYLKEVFRLAPMVGLDASVVVSQSAWETGNWSSIWWLTRRNPAGIGITGDPTQNAASKIFADGTEAARAQIVHLWLHAAAGSATPEVLKPFYKLDPRAGALLEEEWAGTVKTIDDLSGKWAVDPDYAEGIAAKGNAIFPGIPDQQIGDTMPDTITFGKVIHPDFVNRDIPDSQNSAWNNLGPRTVRAVVWHRMLGSLKGTDGYFRGEGGNRALTDYGVGVAAQDGSDLAGVIYRWNDPRGHRSPWANGVVSAPYGDGLAFVNKYGVNAVNRDATAIEISGFEKTALDEKSRAAVADLTAYWADQYEVPWDTFPMVPGEGRSFVCWHESSRSAPASAAPSMSSRPKRAR